MASKEVERVPVLIVGGSLVGLSTSLFLGRLGVEHLLVERHAATSHHPRGRGNNVRTMELYRGAGVEQSIRDAASVLAENHGILQAGSRPPHRIGNSDQRLVLADDALAKRLFHLEELVALASHHLVDRNAGPA